MPEERKVKLAFFMPVQMQVELHERLQDEGYGKRKKSQWVYEAIRRFFLLPNKEGLVFLAHNMGKLEYTETITVPRSVKISLDQLAVEVKRKSPELEGLQSAIIRASIIQRLIGRK